MKSRFSTDCKLVTAQQVRIGDTVVFDMPSANYCVCEVDENEIGMIRHHFHGGSSCYWPNELLYVVPR